MITDERIAEISQLCESATAGAWRWGDPDRRESRMSLYSDARGAGPIGSGFPLLWLDRDSWAVIAFDDTAFIAAARTVVPELLAEIKRMRPIYLAAIEWRRNDTGAEALRTCRALIDAVDAAEKAEEAPEW